MKRAAVYLRSSKDRKDVSPDAQRRALKELAASRGDTIVQEFLDAVESGKDDRRPGFQSLLQEVRDPRRGWDTLLVFDTSRLSRRRLISLIFEEQDCRRHGVSVVYRSLPDLDPMTEMLLKSILQAMDEYHSLSSREKGLAGMAENVRQGWRAGGKAPLGYQLKRIATGVARDGEAVTKSVLEPDPETAASLANYMQLRATGIPRAKSKAQASLGEVADTTLIGIEWNALQYAGHTVWNVHAEKDGNRYVGGQKRRPRKEWVIQRGTHPALITDAEAEHLLGRLEAAAAARRAKGAVHRDRTSTALLGGLLFAPDGAKWWAEADRYRLPGKPATSIARAKIEDPVLERVLADLASPEFALALISGTRQSLASDVDRVGMEQLKAEVGELATRAAKAMDLATQMEDPAPALRRVEELERDRTTALAKLRVLAERAAMAEMVGTVRTTDVQRELAAMAELAREGDAGITSVVMALVERVELDPVTLDASLVYRVSSSQPPATAGVKLASPRGFEPRCPP